MTQTQIIDPVRWQDFPARVIVESNNSAPRVYYQVISPLNISAMCQGRPVEEIPRISTILSSAHHLVSAKALDRLFDVVPPPLAVNMRQALLQTQFLTGHLRKLYFLLSVFETPFQDSTFSRRGTSQLVFSSMAKGIMHHLALAQEAATILGGRNDHPLTAVAGGVSRYLKNDSYERLEEIAGVIVQFLESLAGFFRKHVWANPGIMKKYAEISLQPMSGLSLDISDVDSDDHVQKDEFVVTDQSGKETMRFSVEKALEKIDFATEAWSYLPFAFFREKGWQGVTMDSDSLFFTGPLARMNSCKVMDTEKAEQERLTMIEHLGPFPHFHILAAFWALIVEALRSAEKMTQLCRKEKLTGPFTRKIPKNMGTETFAVLEGPQGMIYHHYQVDSSGLVENIRILDTSVENNALRCLTAQKAHEVSIVGKDSWEKTKNRIEVSLLPF